MTTAFVLTGGGSLGAVQVGMLKALHEKKIEPDLLVGTSVGAVNAAYVAGPLRGGRGKPTERLESLTCLWHRLRRQDVFILEPWRWWAAARGSQSSMFSGSGLQGLLEQQLGYDALQDARLPVEVTVTDLVTGIGGVLDTGPAVTAVRASAAVPGILPPVVRDGKTLVDGAIGDLDVLRHTASRGVTDIYLLPAGYPCAGPAPSTALGIALTSLSLLLHRQLTAQVRDYAGPAQLHVVPPLCPLAVSPADFGQAPELVQRALRSTRDWLETVGAPQDARVLALHTHAPRPQRRRHAMAHAPGHQEPQPHEGVTP
jgi:NTE family protein